MTDGARRGRGLVGLALVPVTAGLFGAGVTWAEGHHPTAPASTAPAAAPALTVDPRIDALATQVADARARVAAVRAALDQRSAEAATAQATSAQAASGGTAAIPSAPAPPLVDTTTKASG
ncbi:hypothetical protein [Cellulomonas sp.]|uniref:hypothetical protein n=1 Tax=Cellulomonas sp. TaxID=40001 RepID=UPI003BAA85D0